MTTISRRVARDLRQLGLVGILVGALAFGAATGRSALAQSLGAGGSWVSSSSVDGDKEGTWELKADKSDTGLTGNFSATGPSDFAQGSIFGALEGGGDIHFGIVYNEVEEAVFTGSVVGAVASGTYSTKNGDSGHWTGSFGPAPSK